MIAKPLNPKEIHVLTAEEVTQALQYLLAAGWGELRVVIQDHYIATMHTSKTLRGVKPETPVRRPARSR